MHSDSILLFIFVFVLKLNYSFSFWKKSKNTLEDYIIDVLFANSLTLIRCNPYELHALRDMTIEKIGYIKCSNKNLFLPEDHIKSITLLQWNLTSIKCGKSNVIKEERTHLEVKHKAKNAFDKVSLELTRVGSSGPSELNWNGKDLKFSFKHPKRDPSITHTEADNASFSMEIFSFKKRPILCREKQSPSGISCLTIDQHRNFSYICYYKVSCLINSLSMKVFLFVRLVFQNHQQSLKWKVI